MQCSAAVPFVTLAHNFPSLTPFASLHCFALPLAVRFRDGYVMVGFSLGFLVVISTHLDEIGREQFCARFHRDCLRDLAYTSSQGMHRVATAGDNLVKVVDLRDWKEVLSVEIEASSATAAGARTAAGVGASGGSGSGSGGGHHGAGPLDKLCWTPDGNYLSVSTRSGCLYVYAVDSSAGAAGGTGAAGVGASAGQAPEDQALVQRLLHQRMSGLGMAACASTVLLSGALGLASAAGLSLVDAARLLSPAWSV